MNIDKYELYHEFSIRIASSLDISTSLMRSAEYLRKIIPLNRIVISLFETESKRYHVVASATALEGTLIDRYYALPKSALKQIENFNHDNVYITAPGDDSVLLNLFGDECTNSKSCAILPLTMSNELLGVAIFFSQPTRGYDEKDAQLISYLSQPFSIALANSLKHLELNHLKDMLAIENSDLRRSATKGGLIIGERLGLKNVFRLVNQVASTDSPVLLLGETGVGKEVIASEIHRRSRRCDNAFIKMNCGAIPETLADSELFGHEKGSFTGAEKKYHGRFERANKGTLLLDEIGELPLSTQVKLLRVIQEKEFERIGGSETIHSDARIICSTNRNLDSMVNEGTFREDLFYRLNVFPIIIPPLRQHREDIPELIKYFLDRKTKEMGLRITPEISSQDMSLLYDYTWPGNIRELQNIVEHALITRHGNRLSFDGLISQHGSIKPAVPSVEQVRSSVCPISTSLESSMRQTIINALEKTNWKVSGPNGAAELLGINPSTLRSKIKKLKITRE